MTKFKNKFRIESARLQLWDYGLNGAYFITICTKNRNHFFGEINNGEMHINALGKLTEKFWIEIPQQFPFIELGNFVVMPNHVHGILIIDKNDGHTEQYAKRLADDSADDSSERDGSAERDVETRLIASLPNVANVANVANANAPNVHGGITGSNNPMFHENISRIIRWYKGRSTFELRKINPDFGWQTRFHDHIIRNSKSFENIQNYIANNPLNWTKNKFHLNNDEN